mgnify:CR=1 FL=1
MTGFLKLCTISFTIVVLSRSVVALSSIGFRSLPRPIKLIAIAVKTQSSAVPLLASTPS